MRKIIETLILLISLVLVTQITSQGLGLEYKAEASPLRDIMDPKI